MSTLFSGVLILKKYFQAMIFFLLFLVTASNILACSGCISGTDNSATSFLITAAFMGSLPITMIGGFSFYLYRKRKARNKVQLKKEG
ncbi:MAG: hypothetical protein ACI86H_000787 [bacterium]